MMTATYTSAGGLRSISSSTNTQLMNLRKIFLIKMQIEPRLFWLKTRTGQGKNNLKSICIVGKCFYIVYDKHVYMVNSIKMRFLQFKANVLKNHHINVCTVYLFSESLRQLWCCSLYSFQLYFLNTIQKNQN